MSGGRAKGKVEIGLAAAGVRGRAKAALRMRVCVVEWHAKHIGRDKNLKGETICFPRCGGIKDTLIASFSNPKIHVVCVAKMKS